MTLTPKTGPAGLAKIRQNHLPRPGGVARAKISLARTNRLVPTPSGGWRPRRRDRSKNSIFTRILFARGSVALAVLARRKSASCASCAKRTPNSNNASPISSSIENCFRTFSHRQCEAGTTARACRLPRKHRKRPPKAVLTANRLSC